MNGNNFFDEKCKRQVWDVKKKVTTTVAWLNFWYYFLVRKSALSKTVYARRLEGSERPWQRKAQNRHLELAEMTSSFLKDFGAKHNLLVPVVMPAWVLSPWWTRTIWGSNNMECFFSLHYVSKVLLSSTQRWQVHTLYPFDDNQFVLTSTFSNRCRWSWIFSYREVV